MTARDILGERAWRVPQAFRRVVTLEKLQEIMLTTEGEVLSCGVVWEIRFRELCPGVYAVTLKRKQEEPAQ